MKVGLYYGYLVPSFIDMILTNLPFDNIGKNIKRAAKELELYIQEIVQNSKNGNDFLGYLYQSTQLTQNELKADSFIFLVAGHETVATALSWVLCELCKHPKVQQKLIQEINETLKGRKLMFEDIEKLHYVHQ